MSTALTPLAQETPSLAEFRRFAQLIERSSGIHLSDGKRALLAARLARRLRELGEPSFGSYFARVQSDAEERDRMLDCVCTNETRFFREPQHFTLLDRVVLPALARRGEDPQRRSVRVWSAACSTGEEPYSLAMALLARFAPEDGWKVEVVATDLSRKALAVARAGVYSAERVADVPRPLLRRFMLKGTGAQAGRVKVAPELREVVKFARVNLTDPTYAVGGGFDLVFCRNVLIYFSVETKRQILQQLARTLAPEGLLFLGHAETLTGLNQELRPVVPTVYRLPSPEVRHVPLLT